MPDNQAMNHTLHLPIFGMFFLLSIISINENFYEKELEIIGHIIVFN